MDTCAPFRPPHRRTPLTCDDAAPGTGSHRSSALRAQSCPQLCTAWRARRPRPVGNPCARPAARRLDPRPGAPTVLGGRSPVRPSGAPVTGPAYTCSSERPRHGDGRQAAGGGDRGVDDRGRAVRPGHVRLAAAERGLRPHPAAGRRGGAVGPRRDDAVQGRHRRRHRAGPRHRLLPSGARAGVRGDPRPVRPRRAGRRRHRRRRAHQARRARPGRRRRVPAHAHLLGPHRGERRLLRRDRPRARGAAPPGRRRHQDRPARLRLGRRRRRRPGEPGAGRGLLGHRAAHERGLRAAVGDDRGHDQRDRDLRGSRRRDDRRPHRVLRPRPAHQRAAPRPDDRPGSPTGHGQGARARHPSRDPHGLDDDGRGPGRRRADRRRRHTHPRGRGHRGAAGPPLLRGGLRRRLHDRGRRVARVAHRRPPLAARHPRCRRRAAHHRADRRHPALRHRRRPAQPLRAQRAAVAAAGGRPPGRPVRPGGVARRRLHRRTPHPHRRRRDGDAAGGPRSAPRPRRTPGLDDGGRPRLDDGAAAQGRRAGEQAHPGRSTCGARRRSGVRCSRACSTPTAPSTAPGRSSSP